MMERASVTRLYKDRSSHEAIMLLEAKGSKERFRVTVPGYRASILALEGHGLNDRCSLYGILSECVGKLGGAFGSVVVTLGGSKGVGGTMALARGEEIISWIEGDVVELVAFALHVELPIYVRKADAADAPAEAPQEDETSLPSVFEDVLSAILESGTETGSSIDKNSEPRNLTDGGTTDGCAKPDPPTAQA